MPSYVYRCAGSCGYVKVMQALSDPPLTHCPAECGDVARRAIVPGNAAQINTYLPSTDLDYFSALARFPGDPEAYVSGPDSLRRAQDRRRRDGWTITNGDDLPIDSAADLKKEHEQKRKEDLFRATGVEL